MNRVPGHIGRHEFVPNLEVDDLGQPLRTPKERHTPEQINASARLDGGSFLQLKENRIR
jgi:hypothetical protein